MVRSRKKKQNTSAATAIPANSQSLPPNALVSPSVPTLQLTAGKYLVTGAMTQDQNGQWQRSLSIVPEPEDKKAALEVVINLANQAIQFASIIGSKDAQLREMELKNKQLSEDYISILKEKADLEGKVAMLNSQLVRLQEKYDLLEIKLQNITSELKETKDLLNKSIDEANRMKVLAGVGAWIEEARRHVLAEFGVEVTIQTASQEWAKLIKGTDQEKVLAAIKKLFGLTRSQWLMISKEFYARTRCSGFHYLPTYQEVMELLEYLPPPYHDQKPIFNRLVQNLNKLMEKEPEDPAY